MAVAIAYGSGSRASDSSFGHIVAGLVQLRVGCCHLGWLHLHSSRRRIAWSRAACESRCIEAGGIF